jgi:hypothetical protein
MALSRRFTPPDLVEARLAGLVTPGDQRELVTFVRASIETVGAVRVLLFLDAFAGWRPDAGWYNDALWLRDDERVSRIAIVGDRAWKPAVLTLFAQPLRQPPIDYFTTETAARRWLDHGAPRTFKESA